MCGPYLPAGLVYGAAIGNAIGIATEKMSLDECEFHYTAETLTYTSIVRDEHRVQWKQGDWTVDFDQLVSASSVVLSNSVLLCRSWPQQANQVHLDSCR